MEPSSRSQTFPPASGLGPETYRLLFERSPLPMWVFDVETLAFVDVNAAAIRHYGYTHEEFLARTILDIRPPEEVEPTRQYVQTRPADRQVGPETTRTRHRTKDGRDIDVDITWERLEVEGRLRLLVLATDITERLRAKHQLEESEQRFRALARATNDAIWEWDIATGKLLWNEGINSILGYKPNEVEETIEWWKDRIHPADAKRVTTSLQQAIENSPNEWIEEYRFLNSDNSFTHILDRGAIIRDASGRALRAVGGMNDVSERIEANRLLEENRLFIEKAQQVANMGSWRCLLDPQGAQLIWSANVFKIFGITREEFGGTVQYFQTRVHPDDLQKVVDCFEDAKDHGTLYELDHRIIRPDGEVRWVREYGEIIRDERGDAIEMIGIAHDITDRKQMEEALRRSEKRFKRLFDSNLIGILIGDMQGVILEANDAFLRMIGGTREQLEAGGVPAGEVTVGGLSPADFDAIAQLRDHGHYDPYEKAFRRPDGSVVHVLLGGMMLSEGEELTINFAVDISELVEARRSLELANESLEQKVADRTAILQDQYRRMASLKELADNARSEADTANRAKSEFLSRMSHELRTPMNAILGFAQLLELDDLPDESQSSVAQILKAGDHLLTLINEVLDLSRIESGRLSISPERVPIANSIAEVIELCRPTLEKYRLAVHWDPTGFERIHVMADASRLRQVFLNLLSNAAKYNRECGTIHIDLERTTDGYIRTHIRDTGIGIPPEKMNRLFRPFDRLDRELTGIEGSGLGLALTKRLIEVMNGRFDIQSLVEEGTTVTVDMVAAKAPSEVRDPDDSPSTPINVPRILEGTTSTILYIEDNLSNVELVQRIFQATGGVRLLTSLQGGVGIEIALENHPDLILLDLNLPDIDGIGVLRRLRADERTGDIPVIVITADANPQQRERLLSAGANDFLTKPINVSELVAKARTILLQ